MIRLRTLGAAAAFVSFALPTYAQSGTPTGTTMIGISTRIERNGEFGDVSKFVPLAERRETGGECKASTRSPLDSTKRVVRMIFGEDPATRRTVSVTLDSLNQVDYYSDTFGDHRGKLDPDTKKMVAMGLRSSIHVNAAQGFGILENVTPEETSTMRVRAVDVLDAQNLGVPRTMMEHVVRTCGAM
jgi:hypothetical protein